MYARIAGARSAVYRGRGEMTLNEADVSPRDCNGKPGGRTYRCTDVRTDGQTDGALCAPLCSDRTLAGSSRTSSWLVPFDGLSSPEFHGYREEPRSRSGRSLGTAKHRSTHFAALRLLLIIYAASAAPRYQPPSRSRPAHVCRAGTIRIGIIARVPIAGDRANRANPIESRDRFARNNNHDWIPRGFGGRTFVVPLCAHRGPNVGLKARGCAPGQVLASARV